MKKKQVKPPKWAEKVVKWYCNNHLQESILGDLEERFYDDTEKYGPGQSRIRYWINVFRFINKYTLARKDTKKRKANVFFMLPNYLLFGFRILLKQRVYSFIKIFGLGLSIAVVTLVSMYLQNEFTFDRSFDNYNNIYRVEQGSNENKELNNLTPVFSLPFGPGLSDNFPEIERYCRFTSGSPLFRYKNFQESIFTQYCDPGFLKILSYPIINGDKNNPLSDPNSIVITRSSAEKIFHTTDCIGKSIDIYGPNGWGTHVVTAVVEDPATNVSIDFKALLPIRTYPFYSQNENNWGYIFSFLIVQLHHNTNTEEFKKKLYSYQPPKVLNEKVKFFLIPIAETHFDQSVPWWPRKSSKTVPLIMGSIVLVILILAAVNYMLMTLSTSLLSIKEFNIRKIVGAGAGDLHLQLIIQTFLTTTFAFAAGLFFTWFFLPGFNFLADRNLIWDGRHHLSLFVGAFVLSFAIGLIASLYPVLKIARLKSFINTTVISGKRIHNRLSSIMISVQLFFSIFLLSGGFIMNRQLSFMLEKDLGFDKDNIIVIPNDNINQLDGVTMLERFREKYQTLPEVRNISGTNVSFGHGSSIGTETRPDGSKYSVYSYIVDWNYIPTMGMKMKEGRMFRPEDINKKVIVINEAFAKEIGKDKEPVLGRKIFADSEIIGIVKDFNFLPLTQNIAPAYLKLDNNIGYILIRAQQNKIPELISRISKSWKEMGTGLPFNYEILNDQLSESYTTYQRWKSIMTSMAVIGFIISCMGMFGLWGVKMATRTKEIGIRKVVGAGTFSILKLLNREVLIITGISVILSIPLTLIILDKWLDNFAYRISIDWSIFIIIGIISLLISLFTVSFHTIKTSLIKPATILKSE